MEASPATICGLLDDCSNDTRVLKAEFQKITRAVQRMPDYWNPRVMKDVIPLLICLITLT